MNKEQVQELMLGVAAVALAYALYKHFAPAAKAAPRFSAASAINPDTGLSYDPANPAETMSLSDMLKGAIHDINSGFVPSNAIPTNREIFQDVTGNSDDNPYATAIRKGYLA